MNIKSKVNSVVLNYKGWFNLYSWPEAVDLEIKTNGRWSSLNLDASKVKWYMSTEVLDENFKVKMEYDEDNGEEYPVIQHIPFNGELHGNIGIEFKLNLEKGKVESRTCETPTDCTVVGYTCESARTNLKTKRYR